MKTTIKTVNMTESEWRTLLEFLEELRDHQSNAGCNDLPKGIQAFFTKEEGKALADEFATYNNSSKPEGPEWPLPDFCLLDLLKHKIQIQI